jgi:hypothetical protein
LAIAVQRPLADDVPLVRDAVRIGAWQAGGESDCWDAVAPDKADLIVVPWLPNAADGHPAAVAPAMQTMLSMLPNYARFADKYVLLDNSDLDCWEPRPRGFLFKTSVGHRSPGLYALPYNVADPGEPTPIGEAQFDVGFQGSVETHPIRQAMNLWRYGWTGWRVAFTAVEPFWTLPAERQAALRASYAAQLRACRFVLCPRGRGLNSRRFYEALAYGRIPILYSDAAKLPLESRLPWKRIAVRVPEGFGKWTDQFVARFLDDHDLAASSSLARDIWLDYLRPQRLRRLIVATLQDAGVLPERHRAEPA